VRDATIAAIPVSVADTAPTASTCAFCREAHPGHDFTTCDQCDAPVCVHCCNTRDSEDVVCPECFKQHWRGILTERLAATTRTVCEDCGCEEYCIDYLRDSLAELADPAPVRSLFGLLEPRTPAGDDVPVVLPAGSTLCPSCGGTGENDLQRDGRGDGTPCELCTEPDPAPDLTPEPWGLSIAALDSWDKYYRDKLRAGLSLSAAESAHRAEVARNIALRHEASRHTIGPR
jgi:hypothetical protein